MEQFAGEVISASPYYQKNIRKHTTSAGEILCTGAGCIGCNPEKNADENISKLLGDVDSVSFEKNAEIRKSDDVGKRPETAPGCHRNSPSSRTISSGRKITSKRLSSKKNRSPKIVITDGEKSKSIKNAGSQIVTNDDSLLKSKGVAKINKVKLRTKQAAINDDKLLGVPGKKRNQSAKRVKFSKRSTESNAESNVRTIDRRRSLYNTFPYSSSKSAGTLKLNTLASINNSTNTSFLEMLKRSEAGIYDLKLLDRKHQSIWIQKILERGISEDQLLPKIPQSLNVRRSGDGSEREMVDKNVQTASRDRIQNLPCVSLNSRVQTRGGESILIIEHDHENKKPADKTLYRLGFMLEDHNQRSFPKFSIIEIADSLGEFVQMGSIKVIQRRNKRWLVLVEGKTVKEFLIDSGVILGGRHFELFEMKTF